VDSGFLGLLMLLYGHQSNQHYGLRVLPPNPAVRRLFRLHCAEFLLKGLPETQTDSVIRAFDQAS
jgi:hypothetical protein